VSQYIANLNQLSPQQDLLADPAPTEDFSDFLNGEFFDVDNARNASNASVDFASASDFGLNFDSEQTQPLKTDGDFPRNPAITAEANMDFSLNVGDFPFTDFNNFGTTPAFDPSMPLAHTQPTHYPLAPNYASPASSLSPVAQGFDQSSKKRKRKRPLPHQEEAARASPRAVPEGGTREGCQARGYHPATADGERMAKGTHHREERWQEHHRRTEGTHQQAGASHWWAE